MQKSVVASIPCSPFSFANFVIGISPKAEELKLQKKSPRRTEGT